MLALVCDMAFANGLADAAAPSDIATFTGPEPVRYAMIVLPALAGFAAVFNE